MKYLVVSVRDVVNHEFGHLCLERSEATAVRNFESSVRTSIAREEGLLFSSPSDFWLMVVGEFDSETGEITPVTSYKLVDGGEF